MCTAKQDDEGIFVVTELFYACIGSEGPYIDTNESKATGMHTISITNRTKTVHAIPAEYLPSTTLIVKSLNDDSTLWTAEQWAEYYEAWQNGQRLLMLNGSNGSWLVIGFDYSYGTYTCYMLNSYVAQIVRFFYDGSSMSKENCELTFS